MSAPAFPERPWVIDFSGRAKFRLTGADRVRFLNGQVSNDVRRASATEAIYACVMTIKGKMCGDAFIHAGADGLLLDAPAELRETLAARLERYIIADDVALDDVTGEFSLFHVIGGALEGVRADRFGREGHDRWFPAGAGAPAGHLLTPAQAETLRIEAGVPRWGTELTEDTLPAEADLEDRAVDFKKGCYIGQEVVSRIKSVGHVNWNLRGLRSPGGGLVPGLSIPGPDGKSLVRVTSVAPRLDGSGDIALGYVRRGSEAPGTILVSPAGPVEVVALPFPT